MAEHIIRQIYIGILHCNILISKHFDTKCIINIWVKVYNRGAFLDAC